MAGVSRRRGLSRPRASERCVAVGYSTHKYANREYETRYERRVGQREVRETAAYRVFSKNLDGAARSGDSGGGLFCGDKLVGVLSCTTGAEDDHARFDVIRGWIDFTIARWRY